jgi:hypothetical protein
MRILLIAGFLALEAAAQTQTEPSQLVHLIRRPGIDASSVRRYVEARAGVNVVGMTSVTGPSESWLIATHVSLASIEDVDRSVPSSAALRTPEDQLADVFAVSRNMIALYRPGLSYRPDQAIRMFSKARYLHASIYRMRPGADADFAELVKLRRSSFDSVNLDRPDFVYQVISGAASGTYLVLAPLTSLKILDDGLARTPVYADSTAAAKASKIASESELSRVHLLLRVEPAMSYVSDDFASGDPEFWRPKTP